MVRRSNYRLVSIFLFSSIPLICIPLVVGAVLYVRTAELITEEVVERNTAVLQHAQESVEAIYKSLSELSARIAYNPRIMRLLDFSNAVDRHDIYGVRVAQQELSRYILMNPVIEDVYVWFPNVNILLSQETTYLDPRLSYDVFFAFDGLTYPQWRSWLMGSRHNARLFPATGLTNDNVRKSVVPYVQSLPFDNPGENIGSILATISEKELHNLLSGSLRDTGGEIYIVDRNGELITALGTTSSGPLPPTRFEVRRGDESGTVDDDALVIYNTSTTTGWQFVSVVPKRVLLRKVNHLRSIMIVSAALLLLTTLPMAIAFAAQKARPFRRLAQAASVHTVSKGYREIVADVESRIRHLNKSNTQIRAEIQQYLPDITSTFLNRLLTGQLSSRDELLGYERQTGTEIKGNVFGVLIVRLKKEVADSTNETVARLNRNKVMLRRLLAEHLGNEVLIHEFDIDSLALILRSEIGDIDTIKDRIESAVDDIYDTCTRSYGFSFVCVAGQFYGDPLELHASYYEALSLLSRNSFGLISDEIAWYAAPDIGSEYRYYYPLHEEQRIINVVNSGDFDGLQTVLNRVFDRNLPTDATRRPVPYLLFHEMQATLIKCSREVQYDDTAAIGAAIRQIDTIDGYTSAQDALGIMAECYRKLCTFVDEKKKSHNKVLGQAVARHIDDNFRDHQLCLASIAESFHMSEVYFSQFFKEQRGVNFHAYLENTRLAEANNLLSQDATVDDVALAVGYNSSNTFRRAYKRHFGITPSCARAALREGRTGNGRHYAV